MQRVNVDQMLQEIDAVQWAEWREYARLNPFDEERMDIRFAQIAWIIANVNRDPKKQRQPFALEDFVLRFGDAPALKAKKKEQTWQEMKAIGFAIANAENEKIAFLERVKERRRAQQAAASAAKAS